MNHISDEKQKVMARLLSQPLIARLATADRNCQPHVVPVWFGWDGMSLWISSFSNTRKINDIQQNPSISVVIDQASEDNHASAVILEGQAELVTAPRDFLRQQFLWIYTRYLGVDGVKAKDVQGWIEDSHNLLVKLTPEKVLVWDW